MQFIKLKISLETNKILPCLRACLLLALFLAYPSTQRADVRTNLSFITTEVQVGPAPECETLFSPEFFILSFLLCSPHANNKKKSFFTHVQVLPFYHIKLLTKFAFGLITVLFSIYYLNIIIKC